MTFLTVPATSATRRATRRAGRRKNRRKPVLRCRSASAPIRESGLPDRLKIGHGGFFDRLDSAIFSAPIFCHLTRYGWSTT